MCVGVMSLAFHWSLTTEPVSIAALSCKAVTLCTILGNCVTQYVCAFE